MGVDLKEGERSVSLEVPRSVWREGLFFSWARALGSRSDLAHGYALAGSSGHVQSSLSFTYVREPGAWRRAPTAEETARQQECFFYQGQEGRLRARIRRAEWGDVLTPAHLAGLGGTRRARRRTSRATCASAGGPTSSCASRRAPGRPLGPTWRPSSRTCAGEATRTGRSSPGSPAEQTCGRGTGGKRPWRPDNLARCGQLTLVGCADAPLPPPQGKWGYQCRSPINPLRFH